MTATQTIRRPGLRTLLRAGAHPKVQSCLSMPSGSLGFIGAMPVPGLLAAGTNGATGRWRPIGSTGLIGLLGSPTAVLDIGCGSGEPIGRYLVERGCDLTGVDSAPEMIALCEARLHEQSWRVADMRSLSLGQVFDGILAWDSFFHLCPDDQRQMFPAFRAHAASGAALMFTSGPEYGVAMGTFEGEPLYHASLDGAEYRALLAENGFDLVAHAVEDPACGRHTIWLARLR